MANPYFQFKQFTIQQDKCAMKVTTDSCLFGAWVTSLINNEKLIINNCLDIGTGTGLLTLMLSQKNSTTEFDAVEIDSDAAAQAQANADESPWKEKIVIMPGDAKDMAYTFAKKYDVIISNPPFYENELVSPNDQRSMAYHHSGLLLTDLLQIIKDLLQPEGRFYLLLTFKRSEEIKKLLANIGLHIHQMVLVRPSINHNYSRIMLEGKHLQHTMEETLHDEIAIKEGNGKYTPEFTSLLKDYYLYL